ncbi:uncharacterized protein [Spinacia oleracea]|uniref:Uncharacterized protein n=1 Tax=Spinacia oleracea TaxID=3562 RepID=A0ABM3RHA4_SPIOL|nr:uncharacterized protein LOC110789611 [Spinacia oleracea]
MGRSKSVVARGKGESGSTRVKSLNPIYSTVVDPAAFVELAGLPPSAEVKIPGSDEEAFDCPEGYVVMYEHPFTIGFKFPFTPLVRSFIEVFHLSPGQLMPQIWRVFTVVHGVTANWRTPFDLSDLMYSYDLALQKCCRYTLVTKKGKTNLGVGLGVNDRGWQSRFVFVGKDSLGDKGRFLVEGWTMEVVKGSSLTELNADSEDKYRKFLGYSVEDRSFSRDGEFLDEQEVDRSGDVAEEEEIDEGSGQLTRRRKRLDLLEEVVANSSSAEGEVGDMADNSEHTLSSRPVSRMSQSEIQERARKRLRSSSTSGGRGMTVVPRFSAIGSSAETPVVIGAEGFHPIASSSPPQPFKASSAAVDVSKVSTSSAKKRPVETDPVEDTVITLPPSFLGDEEASVIWPFADRLILPTTYRRYHEVDPLPVASDAAELSLRASQAALAVRRQCSLLCDEVTNARQLMATAKKAAASWEAKWKAAEKKVVDLAAVIKAKGDQLKGKDKQLADVAKDLEKVKEELTSTTEELDGLRSLYDALQEEAKDVEALAIWRTRAQMMYSCLIGETSLWPCQKEVDDYLANGGTMADLSVPVVDSEELAKTADTASTEATEVDAALLVVSAPVPDQEGEVLAVGCEEEALAVVSQDETVDVASVEVPVVPPEQEPEQEVVVSTQEEGMY